MRILIAEDDRIPLEALRALLSKWGREVIACSNGTDAWEILQRDDAPKLAILDWLMPGMEGIEIWGTQIIDFDAAGGGGGESEGGGPGKNESA